jgi:phenol 2-monooxygenase
VLSGRSPASLLATYSAERHVVAKNLIEFDREWSTMMAKKPEEFESPSALEDFYVATAEFPAGFMTQYEPSMIVGSDIHQSLATGFPLGKRFKSARVVRVADANDVHLGHHHRADGRWRVYAFADAGPGVPSAIADWAEWMSSSPESPLARYTRPDEDIDALLDVKVVYPVPHAQVDLGRVPRLFLPITGPFQLIDYEKVYALHRDEDIFEARGIDSAGCVIVVRPDHYVAAVLPLTATDELAAFFARFLVPAAVLTH